MTSPGEVRGDPERRSQLRLRHGLQAGRPLAPPVGSRGDPGAADAIPAHPLRLARSMRLRAHVPRRSERQSRRHPSAAAQRLQHRGVDSAHPRPVARRSPPQPAGAAARGVPATLPPSALPALLLPFPPFSSPFSFITKAAAPGAPRQAGSEPGGPRMGFLWTGTWILVLVLHGSPLQAFPKPGGSQGKCVRFSPTPPRAEDGLAETPPAPQPEHHLETLF